MKDALMKITAYNVLIEHVEALRRKAYSHENSDNAKLLIEIWNGLLSADDAPLNLTDKIEICSKWKEIGFQGTDPSTDLRGMGLLGLHCLKYYSIIESNRN